MASYQRRFERDYQTMSDSEEEERAKKRSKDRAKRRFEEGDEHFHKNFMNDFRFKSAEFNDDTTDPDSEENSRKNSFKGEDIKIEISISFKESILGTTKGVMIDKNIRCPSCEGTRAEDKTQIFTCIACKGTGTKKDQFFRNTVKCHV